MSIEMNSTRKKGFVLSLPVLGIICAGAFLGSAWCSFQGGEVMLDLSVSRADICSSLCSICAIDLMMILLISLTANHGGKTLFMSMTVFFLRGVSIGTASALLSGNICTGAALSVVVSYIAVTLLIFGYYLNINLSGNGEFPAILISYLTVSGAAFALRLAPYLIC